MNAWMEIYEFLRFCSDGWDQFGRKRQDTFKVHHCVVSGFVSEFPKLSSAFGTGATAWVE